ncbi:hypothetical protein LAZ67_13000681 [Cordylochernes scorpioides]|uniref:Mos1 transposase HTH domain-containing protein n=1 Tax=Cordylochernes scorpioides TaxID=51811 RepID=A0ABY6L377_9ARAC|nr:hypothetical protein LAZ67_13000681 [Cordylochernes scorpioides]
MEQKLKQRICIEFCVKLQISATETFEMLNKVFPNEAPKRTTVFEWNSRFKAGRISIEDDPQQDTGISQTTIERIVTEDLKLKKTPAKFIPRFLTNEQKLCDETWVYGYDSETKRQSAEWRGQETLALMNEAYEDEKLSRTQVYFWYKCFKDSRKSIADDSRSGQPLTSTTDRNIGQQATSIKDKLGLGQRSAAPPIFQSFSLHFPDTALIRQKSQSEKWHKAFKECREEVADEPRSGRPTTARTDENVDRVIEVLHTDRRLSIQQIADTLHMSTFVVHGIVTEDLQVQRTYLRCQELLDLIQNEPDFLNSVVTGDESWMFEYDPESKRQSCAWHTKSSPRPKKARMSKLRIKTMIIVFFDIRGIVHCEFVPQGQTVNSAFYLEVLRRLKRRIARVRTDIKHTVKLHHDNATSHTAFMITNFLARSNTSVIPHPPYSPDLAPCDFFLLPRLKREMKGKHWEPVENIQHHVTTFLRSIPAEEFQGAFQPWQTRLRKCIDAGGMYFDEY